MMSVIEEGMAEPKKERKSLPLLKKKNTERVPSRLSRIMRRVAAAAVLLLFLQIILGNTFLYGNNAFGILLKITTVISIIGTIAYYSLRIIIFMKSRLLWRVRRRLIITYLFIGLTPILLLTVFEVISMFSVSAEAMARILAVQIVSSEKRLLENTKSLANGLSGIDPSSPRFQAFLDEQMATIHASLPKARCAIWRSGISSKAFKQPADITSNPTADSSKINSGFSDSLPEWLQAKTEWSGFIRGSRGDTGWQSLRAVVKKKNLVILTEFPIDASYTQRLTEETGITVQPEDYEHIKVETSRGNVVISETSGESKSSNGTGSRFLYPVVFSATKWKDGTPDDIFVPMSFSWSPREASKQLLGKSELGQHLRVGLVGIGITFIVVELIALLIAVLMTRAVTGTVHELYTATEYITYGNFNYRARVRSRDQLGELAEAFNDMSEHIETLLEERVERERLEREVEIAAEVQSKLFPRELPRLPTVEIAAECRAARGVAGDYYDCLMLSPGHMLLALGDVSGKGLSASLVMSNLQASFRAQATMMTERSLLSDGRPQTGNIASDRSMGHRPVRPYSYGTVSRMTSVINEQLCQSMEANRFATLFLGLYDEPNRTLYYTNSGHNAAMLIHSDGSIERLERGGMMVGAFDWATFEEAYTTISPDAVLIVFSDGLTEARSLDGEEYGDERLVRFAIDHRYLPADRLLDAIFQEVDNWTGSREREDDQTLVVVKAAIPATAIPLPL